MVSTRVGWPARPSTPPAGTIGGVTSGEASTAAPILPVVRSAHRPSRALPGVRSGDRYTIASEIGA